MPDVKQQEQPQQLETFQSDNFASIYSNSVTMEVTPWDFKFTFGALISQGQNKPPKIENRMDIVMSPQHAKAFLAIFATHLGEYEKRVGEIKLPQAQPAAEQPAIASVPNVKSH